MQRFLLASSIVGFTFPAQIPEKCCVCAEVNAAMMDPIIIIIDLPGVLLALGILVFTAAFTHYLYNHFNTRHTTTQFSPTPEFVPRRLPSKFTFSAPNRPINNSNNFNNFNNHGGPIKPIIKKRQF
ncbi:Oidioi.mRNA.OKI2018_I69.XSR.g16907.t1.cds [Oikopleura dioica]|uniref:Oidioi.mRNA.OKI2018_I69.XSR.g16907.t1.cds n=1 Tax=Oikopleura dioica TaxID=34765 RepID=A0ABN7SLG5_OIKDI|nr:Oidioi.mRNA.OKI2018_I69.XSR.g16907.t1.cds [Oikopleura dioica]